jgi:hypothetical protein
MPVTNVRSEWVDGDLIFRDKDGTTLARFAGSDAALIVPNAAKTVRSRFTIAQVNAGVELLPAIDGYKYRFVAAKMIGVGGAVTANDTVDILGTQSTSKKLVTFAQSDMTENTVVGEADGTYLAAGASFEACDEDTAITVDITGSDITTATHIDVILTYSIEEA